MNQTKNTIRKKCGVYEIRHIESGKCYVGSSIDIWQRWHSHRSQLKAGSHHSRRMQRSWTKYGAEAFKFSVVLLCSTDSLTLYEQAVIDARDAYRSGFNGAPRAYTALGTKHSEATKRRLSEIGRGRKHSPEHCAAISAAMIGKKLPLKVIEKMRNTKTGVLTGPLSQAHRDTISRATKGRKKSPEQVAKMSLFRHTEESKLKVSIAKTGKKMPPRDPEHTRKQQESSRRTIEARKAAAS